MAAFPHHHHQRMDSGEREREREREREERERENNPATMTFINPRKKILAESEVRTSDLPFSSLLRYPLRYVEETMQLPFKVNPFP